MREILFKAKTILTNEWIVGYIVPGIGLDSDKWLITEISKNGSLNTSCTWIIDPETICQYTGLTDKNGNKIWENDIVYIPYERLEDSYCKVVFRRGGFIGEMVDGCEDCLLNRKIEVIGNIFDNQSDSTTEAWKQQTMSRFERVE